MLKEIIHIYSVSSVALSVVTDEEVVVHWLSIAVLISFLVVYGTRTHKSVAIAPD